MEYRNIPEHLKPYIHGTPEQFNQNHPITREVIVNQARMEYELNAEFAVPEQVPLDFTGWEYDSHEYYRDFYDWIYHDILYEYEGPSISITEENANTLFECIGEALAANNPGEGWYGYLITLRSETNQYINSRYGDLLDKLTKIAERYDGKAISINNITIRYTKIADRMRLSEMLYAGNGEGVPKKVEGTELWLLDLSQTTSLCIVNCYLLWLYYTDRNLLDFFVQKPQVFKDNRKILLKKLKHRKNGISIHDLVAQFPHDYEIVYKNNVTKITAEDTLNKCVYYEENGHMYLVAHEKYLQDCLEHIIKKSNQTITNKIHTKNIPEFSNDIHVMDIESFRKLVVLDDVESFCKSLPDSYEHTPLMIGHMDSSLNFICIKGDNCVIDYFDWINKNLESKTVIWAHNGGRYDFHAILEDALKKCDKTMTNPIRILDINGKYIQLVITFSGGKEIYFRDSCSLIPGALNQIAKDFNVSGKLDDAEIDIVNVSRDDLLYKQLYEDYNKQDCKALLDILNIYKLEGISSFGVDPLNHPSASSYGKRIFFSKYYDESKYPLYSLTEKVHKYIYTSYGGGRCEAFNRGWYHFKKYRYYDINSSYPNVGRKLLPYGIPKFHADLKNVVNILSFLELCPGFYKVKIIKSNKGIPIHGVMHEGKYLFPRFNHESKPITLFSEEIKYGISLGWEYKLLDGYEFKLAKWGEKFFNDMYDNKLKAKENGNKALEYIYKITANSSYGFFGFEKYDRSITKIYGSHMEEHLLTLLNMGKCNYYKYEDLFVAHETTNVLLKDVNIAVASAITSYGRMHLHYLMTKIKNHGGQIMYVDTDSIITDLELEKIPEFANILGKQLGQLKSELAKDEHITSLVVVGCKLYGLKTNKNNIIVHAKGVPAPKKKDIKAKHMLYSKLVNMLRVTQRFSVNTMIISRVNKTKGKLSIYDKLVTKKVSGNYTKRHVLDNGKTTARYYV